MNPAQASRANSVALHDGNVARVAPLSINARPLRDLSGAQYLCCFPTGITSSTMSRVTRNAGPMASGLVRMGGNSDQVHGYIQNDERITAHSLIQSRSAF